MDGWVGGWIGGWTDVGAGLKIAYSNRKLIGRIFKITIDIILPSSTGFLVNSEKNVPLKFSPNLN